MKFALSLGVAFAALTLAASAHTDHQRTFIRHHGAGADLNIDADGDGWVTRAEAAAAAERAFDQMDSNDDGRLDRADRRALHTFDVHIGGPEVEVLEGGDGGERVRIIRRGGHDEIIDREVSRAVREAERAVEEAERAAERAEREAERAAEMGERAAREAERAAERAEREAERAERDAERAEREAERHVERHIVIVRGEGGERVERHGGLIAPVPPVPPVPVVPPHPPMFMMLIANSDEADLNGDGALSREEFRNQHLRFFDASDANGDGRIRFEQPPEPPTPPTPPVAPTPPQPPRHR